MSPVTTVNGNFQLEVGTLSQPRISQSLRARRRQTSPVKLVVLGLPPFPFFSIPNPLSTRIPIIQVLDIIEPLLGFPRLRKPLK